MQEQRTHIPLEEQLKAIAAEQTSKADFNAVKLLKELISVGGKEYEAIYAAAENAMRRFYGGYIASLVWTIYHALHENQPGPSSAEDLSEDMIEYLKFVGANNARDFLLASGLNLSEISAFLEKHKIS